MALSLQDQAQIISADNYIICRRDDGTIWGYGSNNHGQLGLPSSISSLNSWTKLPMEGVDKIFNGRYGDSQYSVFVILENGDLYATGFNSSNAILGFSSSDQFGFHRIGIDKVQAVMACSYGTAFIKKDGRVYYTGHSRYLGGLSSTNIITSPTQTSTQLYNIVDACLFNSDTRVMYLRSDNNWFVTNSAVTNLTNSSAIGDYVYKGLTTNAAKIYSPQGDVSWVCYLDTSGVLHTTGANSYGQLGNNSTSTASTWQTPSVSNISQITLGAYHMAILTTDKTVYCCGRNDYGQCCTGGTSNVTKPTKASFTHTVDFVNADINRTLYRLSDNQTSFSFIS